MRHIILALLISGVMTGLPRVRRQADDAAGEWWVASGSVANDEVVNAQESRGFGSQSETNDNVGVVPVASITRTTHCDGPGTVCVPYYQCNDGNINTDGAGIFDIRTGSSCPRFLDVCCRDTSFVTTPKPVDIYQPKCGHRNSNGVDVRVHGFNVSQTQFGEFPWMTAILRMENIGNEEVNLFLCGGSLIRPNVVLTAAHCVNLYGALDLKVRAGEWDTQSTYEKYPHQDRYVDVSIIHPEFNGGGLQNDFALLILNTPFDLAPNVDTICIPTYNEVFEHQLCSATGWGKDKFGKDGRFQNILKQVELQVIPHGTCELALQNTRLGEYFILDSSFICAGGFPGVDTCKGDGGSPLACAKVDANGRLSYYQVGIVAWGIGCGEDGIPGVYADVTKAVNWINSSLNPTLRE